MKTKDGEVVLEADILLSAVGVVANIENVGLEALGIKTEKGKIVVDANGQLIGLATVLKTIFKPHEKHITVVDTYTPCGSDTKPLF